ncbi:MAG: 2-C-methyl-D-erythritol 4-phosphate cytidylyltransferase [Mycobacteriales bacterium]
MVILVDAGVVGDSTPRPDLVAIDAVLDAVRRGSPAAIVVAPVSDTVKLVDDSGVIVSTVDRSSLGEPIGPMAFEIDVLKRLYASDSGDDLLSAALSAGIAVTAVQVAPIDRSDAEPVTP